MPEVYSESIVDVRLGTQMASALMAGTNELYVRWTKHFYETPGSFSFTLPDWATAYGVIMSGGGGGGYSGNGGNGNNGNGGTGGKINGLWGLVFENHSRVLNITIGEGGAGGTGVNGNRYGKDGGTTSIVTHTSKTYSASGGTANPTMASQPGGRTSTTFREPFSTYFNLPPNSVYTNGPGGTGNAGSGKRGGGGAGGNGGYFGSYTHGGKGGNGFVEIYVWGLPRHDTSPTPPTRETVQITLGSDLEARDQLRAALADRGLDHTTVTKIPFDIALFGAGSARDMFRVCAALKSVPDMDTSGVTNMRSMFEGCSSLTSVPDMDTSQVTDMQYMFQDCSSLTTVASMDTSNVTDMTSMFNACAALTHVPDMDTSQVTDMTYMFEGCSSLTSAPAMDTSQVTDMRWMFLNCSSLMFVPDMDTSQVTDMRWMFLNCSALTDGNVSLIGRHPNVTTTDMITNSGLTKEPFYDDDPTIETVQITLGSGFAARDQFRAALTDRSLDYETVAELPFDIELVGSGEAIHLFYGCKALTSIPPLDTSQVTNTNGMFQECSSLVTVPPLDTQNVWNAPSMFAYCRSLTSVPTMNAAKMTNVTDMFTGCLALTDGNVLLTNRNTAVNSAGMITGSGLTREPFYDAAGNPI